MSFQHHFVIFSKSKTISLVNDGVGRERSALFLVL